MVYTQFYLLTGKIQRRMAKKDLPQNIGDLVLYLAVGYAIILSNANSSAWLFLQSFTATDGDTNILN